MHVTQGCGAFFLIAIGENIMLHRYKLIILILIILSLTLCTCGKKESNSGFQKPYPEEIKTEISRGLVCFPKDNSNIFMSWRLLPTDPEPPEYFIWRKDMDKAGEEAKKIAATSRTCFVDSKLEEGHTYSYAVQAKSESQPENLPVQVTAVAKNSGFDALTFDIGLDYKMVKVVTGDLTGDGELEVLIAYSKMYDVDPYKYAWMESTDSIKLTAFRYNGEPLWTIDLGPGIETGGTYAPIVVWDIDADGRAEVILKTNKSKDPLDYKGEHLTILHGESGKIKQETEWPKISGRFANDYNNNSRNFIAVAHLDGKNPYIIAARGIYTTQVIQAYDNKLNKVWERVLGKDIYNPVKNKWLIKFKVRRIWSELFRDRYKGSHSLPIADVNEDGTEEILWGEHCIGYDGKDLWKIEDRMPYMGHPDIVFAADVIPSLKGKEIYYCREGDLGKKDNIGMLLADSKGKTIWAQWGYTHVDRGWVSRVVPDTDGAQCFGYDIVDKVWTPGHADFIGSNQYLWNADGKLISNPPDSWIGSFTVDWEGDDVREICDEKGNLTRWNGEIVRRLNSGTNMTEADPKLNPGTNWAGDLFGDYREEIVYTPHDGKVYIIFNTDPMKNPPKITRIADRQYKNDLSRTAMQFNVIPTESGFIPFKNR